MVQAGQISSFEVATELSGMVLVSDPAVQATRTFRAEIASFADTVVVRNTQKPVVHFSHGSYECLIMADDIEGAVLGKRVL